jgi:hypothetical protein
MDGQPSNPATTRSPKKPIAKPVQKVSTAVNIEVSHPKKVQQQIRSADDSPLHIISKKRLSKKYRSLSKKCKPIIQILNANCRSVSVVAQPPMTRPPTEAAKKKSRIVFGAPGGPVKPRRIVQFKLQAEAAL